MKVRPKCPCDVSRGSFETHYTDNFDFNNKYFNWLPGKSCWGSLKGPLVYHFHCVSYPEFLQEVMSSHNENIFRRSCFYPILRVLQAISCHMLIYKPQFKSEFSSHALTRDNSLNCTTNIMLNSLQWIIKEGIRSIDDPHELSVDGYSSHYLGSVS